MKARTHSTDTAVVAGLPRRQGLPMFAPWPLLAASLISVSGCMDSEAEALELETEAKDQVAAVDPIQTALLEGAYATPDTIGGFSVDGIGVYLSADTYAAELTLYVAPPAQSATFARPALYITTQEGDHSKTEVVEFEDVTLQAAESRVLRQEVAEPLIEVVANFAGAGALH